MRGASGPNSLPRPISSDLPTDQHPASRPDLPATPLCVVVCVTEGGDALRRCLQALAAQRDAPSIAVVVPWDDTLGDLPPLAAEFPEVQFLAMGRVDGAHDPRTPAGEHELFDARRSAGLAASRSEVTALILDRVTPVDTWAGSLVRLHRSLPHGVIGGAIQPARRDALNWSVWACDFTRYSLPFDAGVREWVSDVNSSYKRRALELTRDIWERDFNEVTLHWTLMERGETMYLSPEPVVDYGTSYRRVRDVLPERFHWGRLFGSLRARQASRGSRLARVIAGPLIALLVFGRHVATQARLGNGWLVLRAAPVMLLLVIAWVAGESWGMLTRRS